MSDAEELSFANASPRWWSMAAQWLGWRPDEFWKATPIELRTALSDPSALVDGQGPSMDLISKMLERENNG